MVRGSVERKCGLKVGSFFATTEHTHTKLYVFLKNKLINMYVCMYGI